MTAPKYHERARAIMGSDLVPTQRFILIVISDHVAADGGPCWPSVARIAARTGYTVRCVHKNLTALEKAHVISVERKPGRANRYTICWSALTPERGSPLNEVHPTPERGSPPNEVHPRTRFTPPLNEVHPTPERGSDEAVQERIKETEFPPTPQGAVDNLCGSIDESINLKPVPKKRSRQSLTLEQVAAIPLPRDLQDLDGYAEAFGRWCEVRKGTAWRRKPDQIERFHRKMAKAHADGLDVLGGLERAYEAGWAGLDPSYLKPHQPAHTGPGPKVNDAEAWALVEQALLHWGTAAPHGAKGWTFSDDESEDARFIEALKGATRRDDIRSAWDYLYKNVGHDVRGPNLRRWFGHHWCRLARQRRGRAAA